MENIKMSETAEKTTGKVNEEVRSVADRFKEAMTVDSKTGVGAGTENAYVAERDARGLTHETVLSVKQFERVVADASTLAAGELGIEALEANKKLDTVTVEVPMFQDRSAGFSESLNIAVHRSTTGRNPRTGEPVVSHGSVRTDYRVTTGTNRGQMSHVREHLRALAADKLG
jgi:hypothetical protein